ncbi:hypothetical protein PAPHI01_1446 [Pancytospora philotis]|nr:hypothetical protein PAPHI01_1446 [Pancytospora philotis]
MFSLACLMSVAPCVLQTVRGTSKRRRDEASTSAEDAPSKAPCTFRRVHSDAIVEKMGDLSTKLKEHSQAAVEPYNKCRALYEEQVATRLASYVEKRYALCNERYVESIGADRKRILAEITENLSRKYLQNGHLKVSHRELRKAVGAFDSIFKCFGGLVRKLLESKAEEYKDPGVARFREEMESLVAGIAEGTIEHPRFVWNDAGIVELPSTEELSWDGYSMFFRVAQELKRHIAGASSDLTMGDFFAAGEDNWDKHFALCRAAAGELKSITGLDYLEVNQEMESCVIDYLTLVELVNNNPDPSAIVEYAADVFDGQFQEKYSEAGAGPDAEQMQELMKNVADKCVEGELSSARNAYYLGPEDILDSDELFLYGFDRSGEDESDGAESDASDDADLGESEAAKMPEDAAPN